MLLRRLAFRQLGNRQLRLASTPWLRCNSTHEGASAPDPAPDLFAVLKDGESAATSKAKWQSQGDGDAAPVVRKNVLAPRPDKRRAGRSFKCRSCGATFPFKQRLEHHIRDKSNRGLYNKGCRKGSATENVSFHTVLGKVMHALPSTTPVTSTSGYEVLGSWGSILRGDEYDIKAPGQYRHTSYHRTIIPP